MRASAAALIRLDSELVLNLRLDDNESLRSDDDVDAASDCWLRRRCCIACHSAYTALVRLPWLTSSRCVPRPRLSSGARRLDWETRSLRALSTDAVDDEERTVAARFEEAVEFTDARLRLLSFDEEDPRDFNDSLSNNCEIPVRFDFDDDALLFETDGALEDAPLHSLPPPRLTRLILLHSIS
ncbi:hypothetical protein GWC77_24610 [Paraburkholderia sp. NMBU_R16]|uniref:hypothetical protein n=1 Tax=Paraburkholderia sp. NMBU_R16 TaxID=2698676 RepID=UPI0015674071|nr:hypothetical protein [Paraburkholderia sp. NMBU_R16]NRO99085.1 hypothetical protein [Paraburkholderia sp. NMBU_R16]